MSLYNVHEWQFSPAEKPSPEIIMEIDTRKQWVPPALLERPWNEAWDDLERAGAL